MDGKVWKCEYAKRQRWLVERIDPENHGVLCLDVGSKNCKVTKKCKGVLVGRF